MAKESEFDSLQEQEVSLPFIKPRPALWTTKPPEQRVPGTLLPEVKRQCSEADHSPQSSADVKNGGTTLPLPHVLMA
jgi:hypothetical protein